jgi:ribonuclease-3 family protein
MNSGYLGHPDPKNLPALVLAYIGDAVYELYIRKHLVSSGLIKVDQLHKQAVKLVNAATQAQILHALLPHLSEDEASVVRRGRNAKSGSAPKNISVTEYRHGTAFEALIGYLHLSGKVERLEQLIKLACKIVFDEEGDINESKTD